ncbi:hypothetical protein HELRODRAFT_107238 [Helobdella robusta]|uniref:Membrane-bound transcription factor site-2 protease n=1 Tax=Helobdella robusta TaxID=6412 RepID=T1EE89_HELRO|nr:hypothetical protein HELRODRAFT_107238 [Helobdella robusta]ESN99309.1 hypothetical protein HELRODRAFT_107238 [Helobdella robusta]
MLQNAFLLFFAVFWMAMYILDAVVKASRYGLKYAEFLGKHGVTISTAQIGWFTTYFNRFFIKIGSKQSTFFKIWFSIGVVFSLVLLIMSMFLLLMIIFNTFTGYSVEQQILTPVMPGINLPMNQVWFYLITLLVCGVLHEVGHALAAVGEDIRVNGFGIFLLLLYPGAYVDVCPHHVQSISAMRQLRIYCAGVWHNIVIVLLAVAFLICFPTFISLFYYSGRGVLVTRVNSDSPISGVSGVQVSDVIVQLDDCHVMNMNQWMNCITTVTKSTMSGYCVQKEIFHDFIVNVSNKTDADQLEDCCRDNSDGLLCFRHNHSNNKFGCLRARNVVEGRRCQQDEECRTSSHDDKHFGDRNFNSDDDNDINHININFAGSKNVTRNHLKRMSAICIHPHVDNVTWLVKVIYDDANNKQPLLFLGHPYDLFYSLSVSDYQPKWNYLPLHLPYILETFCKYLISLSGALAIMNVIPCYALDGQWITQATYNLLLPHLTSNKFIRDVTYTGTIMFGTALILVNVAIAFCTLFLR